MSEPGKKTFEETDLPPAMAEALRNPGFKVPGDYFRKGTDQWVELALAESIGPASTEGRSEPMKVPEGYFARNLEQTLSLLSLVHEKGVNGPDQGFAIPEDYFRKAGYTERVLPPNKVATPLFRSYQLKWAAAAAVIIGIFTWVIWNQTSPREDWASGVSDEALYAYVEAHASEYSLESIAELMISSDMELIDVEEEELEAAEEFLELYN